MHTSYQQSRRRVHSPHGDVEVVVRPLLEPGVGLNVTESQTTAVKPCVARATREGEGEQGESTHPSTADWSLLPKTNHEPKTPT